MYTSKYQKFSKGLFYLLIRNGDIFAQRREAFKLFKSKFDIFPV